MAKVGNDPVGAQRRWSERKAKQERGGERDGWRNPVEPVRLMGYDTLRKVWRVLTVLAAVVMLFGALWAMDVLPGGFVAD